MTLNETYDMFLSMHMDSIKKPGHHSCDLFIEHMTRFTAALRREHPEITLSDKDFEDLQLEYFDKYIKLRDEITGWAA